MWSHEWRQQAYFEKQAHFHQSTVILYINPRCYASQSRIFPTLYSVLGTRAMSMNSLYSVSYWIIPPGFWKPVETCLSTDFDMIVVDVMQNKK